MKRDRKSITPQAAGAFGERAVEAELLRRDWIPANVNATVKNAARFDIYALKKGRRKDRPIQIRVKTCRPGKTAFLFSGFKREKRITAKGIGDTDFTIAVRMGKEREDDQFYIVPTATVWKEIAKRQTELKPRKRKEIGMYRLSFGERKKDQKKAGHGIEEKWRPYLDEWRLLDA